MPRHCAGILFCRTVPDDRQSVLSLQEPADRRAVIVGRANSYLKPIFYVIIFSSFDIIALVIQAVGGAGAARAEEQGTNTTHSTHTLVSLHLALLTVRKRVSLFRRQGTSSSQLWPFCFGTAQKRIRCVKAYQHHFQKRNPFDFLLLQSSSLMAQLSSVRYTVWSNLRKAGGDILLQQNRGSMGSTLSRWLRAWVFGLSAIQE